MSGEASYDVYVKSGVDWLERAQEQRGFWVRLFGGDSGGRGAA